MKNFFKKLAFVLALAMIVTAIAPAAQASAATGPAFKYTKKTLYIGGDLTGKYEDNYRFTFTNAKGYTATWKSSKPSVATIDAKTGEIQAVAVGTATIKATLKNKAGNVVETTAKVYVKQNAEKVGFGTTASVKDMAIGDTGKVNVYRQVGTSKVWKQSDKTLITDVIKWKSSDLEVATVDKWGKVTAVGAGEATITATATQSEYSTAGASKSFKVTVKAGLTEVKQASKNTINATFAGDLSAVANKENVKVYSLVGATKVNVLVKDVVFDKTDKTKAVISTYTDLVKGTDYVVEYTDTTASFKGADLSKDAVDKLVVTTTKATTGVATSITVEAYDANGVLIPAANVASYITLSADASNKYFFDTTTNKVTIFNAGDKAVIKATFHTYTYAADYTENVITAVGEVTAYDAAAYAIKNIDAYTVYTGTAPNWDKTMTSLSTSDNGTYNVAVKYTDSADVKSSSVGKVNSNEFTFESSDETKLIITGSTLYPIKAGTVTVIVKYNGTTITAFPLTIGTDRVATNVTAVLDKTKLSFGGDADKLTLTVKVKDQYDVERTTDTIAVDYVTGPVAAAVAPSEHPVVGETGVFTFNGNEFTVAGNYQYKVTVGNIVRYVVFSVANVASATESYFQLSENGKAVDTALALTDKISAKNFEMKLSSYTADGYFVKNYPVADSAANASVGGYYATISTPTGYTGNFITVTTGGAISVQPRLVGTNGVIEKMKAGTYSIQLFRKDSATASTPLRAAYFTITDTQAAPSVVVNNTILAAGTDLLSALKTGTTMVEVTLNNSNINASIDRIVTIGDVNSSSYYLKEVVVKLTVTDGTETGTLEQTVAVGTTITVR